MTTPVLVAIDPVVRGDAADPAASVHALDPTMPSVHAADLGVTRGDGIFEALAVIDGSLQALGPHLARLQRSATMLDLPELDLAAVEAGIRLAAELYESTEPFLVKVVVTRGVEGRDRPTAWAHAFEMTDYSHEQRHGVTVVSLDRGYRSDVATTSPWLLQGAKTLSYAINRAAMREAARRGAKDVVFISSDGYVLEGPNSTVIARIGDVFLTPPPELGILAGTTQGAAFEILQDLGHDVGYRAIRREELDEAAGVWLLSSGKQAVPISVLDGRELPVDHELTAALVHRLTTRTH